MTDKMKILAVETSAVTCSAAYFDGTDIIEEFADTGLNHSCTLMPMVDRVLRRAGASASGTEVFACSCGPGSFTGVRIGVAAVKGMASAAGGMCAGVSTLETIAMSAPEEFGDGNICCLMDARRGQFYNALFYRGCGGLTRLTDDAAEAWEDIAHRIAATRTPMILMGDGARAFFALTSPPESAGYRIPEGEKVYQRASGVIRAVLRAGEGALARPEMFRPTYLRVPQAEREFGKSKKA